MTASDTAGIAARHISGGRVVASKNSFFDQVKLLRKAVAESRAELLIAGDSMSALVRRSNAFIELKPQFIATIDGARQYVDKLIDEAWQFVGWLPYRNKRWPLAVDKLSFKRYARDAGLKVPELVSDFASGPTGVVVKRASSSFGEQVRGPFQNAADCQLNLAEGEYCEQFVPGRLLKLWFWNATPICAELDTLPVIVGDGVLSIGDLILRRARLATTLYKPQADALLRRAEGVLRYFGTELSTVLPYGQRQVVEFRYGSILMTRHDRRIVDFASPPSSGAEWMAHVPNVGRTLHNGIPPTMREATLFTVDAIVDDANQLWLLEMNCNPTVHPLAYRAMVGELLASADARALAASAASGADPSAIPRSTASALA